MERFANRMDGGYLPGGVNVAIQDRDDFGFSRKMWRTALIAMELHQYAYAVNLLKKLLKAEPDFEEASKLLAKAEARRRKRGR